MTTQASLKLRQFLNQLAPWNNFISTKPSKSSSTGYLTTGEKRVFYINSPENNFENNYCRNVTRTTKYNLITFIPKALFEQYRRAGYWYFTVMAFLSLSPVSPYSPLTVIGPLLFVLGVALSREAWEDTARAAADREVNSRPVLVFNPNGILVKRTWRELRVGDVVKICEGDFFPADLVLLYSSGDGGVCYVETKNLDGETNLKVKQATDETMQIGDYMHNVFLKGWKAKATCEGPNASLYTFTGNLVVSDSHTSLGPQQLLLRESSLQNTDFIIGAAVYTGSDTKAAKNGTPSRVKRSRMDKRLDSIIWGMFLLLSVISMVNAISLTMLSFTEGPYMYYIRPFNLDEEYNPNEPWTVFGLSLVSSVILYGYLIPLAMYVSLELVRMVQAYFISMDVLMGDNGKFAKAKSCGLNEELGQVTTILSDKTGTLTCNQMDFFRCSIAGISYGLGTTEVENAAVRLGIPLECMPSLSGLPIELVEEEDEGRVDEPFEKGFNLRDERLEGGNWVKQPFPHVARRFLEILALCHTAIPEGNYDRKSLKYRAESPDEAAFLAAAKRLGLIFVKRSSTALYLKELYPLGFNEKASSLEGEDSKNPFGWLKAMGRKSEIEPIFEPGQELKYDLLSVLEFTSARRRMSVIVRDPSGKILLLTKGADSAILPRLVKREDELPEGINSFVKETVQHITMFGQAGLRTLTLSYRELDQGYFKKWESRYLEARETIGAKREEQLEDLADELEQELILVGATGLEDKLQDGVSECIEKFALAGIKVWVLTGDKTDTAINIAYACSLLRAGMQRVEVTLESPAAKAAEERALISEGLQREEAEQTLKLIVSEQLNYGIKVISPTSEKRNETALVIDGHSLAVVAAYPELESLFIELASFCESVLCCRVSPKQKATITKMVRKRIGQRGICLAIGDGANDVGMIQAANVGVGISGVEGAQAAMAADYSISQFRFLERLLFVHGHWCYRRISFTINYSLWKVALHGLLLFYSSSVTFWTGQLLFDQWFSSFYNTLFTSMPIGAIGSMDQDVSANECLRHPQLYQQGQKNELFNWKKISGWLFYSCCASLLIFYVPLFSFGYGAVNMTGKAVSINEIGVVIFSSLVVTANLVLFLCVTYYNWIHLATIWGSIFSWFLFIVIYGMLPPDYAGNTYQVFVEILACSPLYWLTFVLTVVVTLLPCFVVTAYESMLKPPDNQIIVEDHKSSLSPKAGRIRFKIPELPRFATKLLEATNPLRKREPVGA